MPDPDFEPPTQAVCYRSYAKLNLYLDILERRPDGFHDIETLFQTVDLFDTLEVSPTPSEITLDCSDVAAGPSQENLVYRAAMLLRKHCGTRRGAHFVLEKRIPVSAGLAGGSGNAAAALIALNELWALGLTPSELATIGLELGSDVPYCLIGGTVAATGRGEILRSLKPLASTWFLLLHPELHVSASSVYGHALLHRNPGPAAGGHSSRLKAAEKALASRDWKASLFNAMERPVFSDHPKIERLKEALRAAECRGALMSGSGPTVFGVFDSESSASAAASRVEGIRKSIVRSVNRGVEKVRAR